MQLWVTLLVDKPGRLRLKLDANPGVGICYQMLDPWYTLALN
jgi:hypothetical protein